MAGAALLLLARLATFDVDATPPPGEPLIWDTPAAQVLDPLHAKGILLDDGRTRVLLVALDWCGLGGSIHESLRGRLARAAVIPASHVALHTVHQHSAPYIEGDGYALLRRRHAPVLRMSDRFLDDLGRRLESAVREAQGRLQPFDRIGTAEVQVLQVASARRVFDAGKLLTRYSSTAANPALAALPEGPVDPLLRSVTFARGEKPLARLHFYATHPQTFCCDGRVSADFVADAREAFEREEKVPQIYFTGAAGDVTVGKYNQGKPEQRAALAARLLDALRASATATRYEPAAPLAWRHLPLTLPAKPAPPAPGAEAGSQRLYRAAIAEAFSLRRHPLPAAALSMGRIRILFLPGEPMLAFQAYAVRRAAPAFLALAGYGDIAPGYLCTEEAFSEGDYEPSAANAGPGTQARIESSIDRLLAPR